MTQGLGLAPNATRVRITDMDPAARRSVAGLEIDRAILVCKAFHARHAHMTYRAVFPSPVQIMVSPIHDGRDIIVGPLARNRHLLFGNRLLMYRSQLPACRGFADRWRWKR